MESKIASNPLVVNEQELHEFLETNPRVIGLIFARWCPFCMQFLPVFQRYAVSHPGRFLLIQDDQEHIADLYQVDVIPTALYFENGQVARRLNGLPGVGLSERLFCQFVEACLKQLN